MATVREQAKSVVKWLQSPAELANERERRIAERERFAAVAGTKATAKPLRRSKDGGHLVRPILRQRKTNDAYQAASVPRRDGGQVRGAPFRAAVPAMVRIGIQLKTMLTNRVGKCNTRPRRRHNPPKLTSRTCWPWPCSCSSGFRSLAPFVAVLTIMPLLRLDWIGLPRSEAEFLDDQHQQCGTSLRLPMLIGCLTRANRLFQAGGTGPNRASPPPEPRRRVVRRGPK